MKEVHYFLKSMTFFYAFRGETISTVKPVQRALHKSINEEKKRYVFIKLTYGKYIFSVYHTCFLKGTWHETAFNLSFNDARA